MTKWKDVLTKPIILVVWIERGSAKTVVMILAMTAIQLNFVQNNAE
jgi:hypothetical protein